jgi:hypothetical protein
VEFGVAAVDGEATAVPARLSVLLARSARVAVVLRRGPSKWVQLLKWHTDFDTFEAGQWFKGRIYDRRSDVSPDGSFFIYFASKFNQRTLVDARYTYAWTAISRPPYFTALALWPKGDCWHGGGLFLGRKRVWLNHKPAAAVPHPDHRPKGLRVEPNPEACGEDWPVWSRRMRRDGWVLVQQGSFASTRRGWSTERAEVWERTSPTSSVRLRRRTDAISFTHPGGPYLESFRLVAGADELPLRDANWADWDQAGRLVFARGGRLLTGVVENGQVVERELIDLNANTPSEIEAPEFAKRW